MKIKIGDFTMEKNNDELTLYRNNRYKPLYIHISKIIIISSFIIILKNQKNSAPVFYGLVAALLFLIFQLKNLIQIIKLPFILKITQKNIVLNNQTIRTKDVINLKIETTDEDEFDSKILYLQKGKQQISIIETSGYKNDIDKIASHISNKLNIEIKY